MGLKRLKQSALLVGAVTLVAGASMLGATAAQAALGSQPGALVVTPTTGATTVTPNYSTTTACPAGFQGSGVVRLVDPATSNLSNLSKVNPSVATPFSGAFNTTFAIESQVFPAIVGATSEMVVDCFSGPSATGTSEHVQSAFVTISADGSTFTISETPPAGPASTTTSLVASPSPATVGQTVTLTATVADGGSTPTGTVQFEVGGTAIGSPVTLATGIATTTTTFAAPGTEALSAVYTPADPNAFSASTGNASLTVQSASANSGTEPLAVTVPAIGTFTLTVGTGTVNLTVSTDGSTGTGALNAVSVADSRNTYPGWSVSGQDSNWAGTGTAAGGVISGNQLGWAPTSTTLAQGVTLGPVVTPAAPGLGTTAAVLASVHAGLGNGFGTSTFGAGLTLAIPPTSPAGPYTSTLTVTAVTSNP
jgi:hypothetical protein